MHITAHIDHSLWPELSQLLQEIVVASFPRRVENDDSLVRVVLHGFEELVCVSGDEDAALVSETVELSVTTSAGDAVRGNVYACGVGELRGERDGEEPGAGVCVYEVLDRSRGGRGQDVVPDVGCELGQDGVVVLEEGVGGVGEDVVVDVF